MKFKLKNEKIINEIQSRDDRNAVGARKLIQ
jgi:hypothetical protein